MRILAQTWYKWQIAPEKSHWLFLWILEFQGPACFAHKYVCFAHKSVRLAHIHLFINIIMATIASNKKCLSPPSMKNVCPLLNAKMFVPLLSCVWKCLSPPSLLCVRNVYPPLSCVKEMLVPQGTNKLLVPRRQTNCWGQTKCHRQTDEQSALYI